MYLSIRFLRLIVPLIFIVALTSCSGSPPSGSQFADPTPIVVRILDLDAPARITPTALPTFTPLPTLPPTPTAAQSALIGQPTHLPGSEASPTPACRNQAEFVKNLSLGDNAAVKVGQAFVKIWQIRNTGACVWTVAYSLVLVAGESLNAPTSVPMPHEVKPGETVDLRVNLVAPEIQGIFTNNWMIQDPTGGRFGVGDDSSDPLMIQIIVNPLPRGTPG